MARDPLAPIVFCAAAGPRLGFGHLVRCRSLARALGVEPLMALRGTRRTRERAAALGARMVEAPTADALRALAPSLLVVDEPSLDHAERWVHRARHAGIPVASVHDLGLSYVPSDLLIDGSVRAGTAPEGCTLLAGPAYAILDPALQRVRRVRARAQDPRVLVALGGGRHVRAAATRLTEALARRLPNTDLRVARGLAPARTWPALSHGRWVDAPDGLACELAEASVAVVAGGVTLYEACALGVPAVAVAVTAAQQQTIRAMARRGAVVDGGGEPFDQRRCDAIAEAVAHLIDNRARRTRQVRAARRLVDARGASRVARRLRGLVRQCDVAGSARLEVRRAS